MGDRIRVLAESALLRVIPGSRFSEANTKAEIDVDGTISHVDFKEEVDGIKAEKDCITLRPILSVKGITKWGQTRPGSNIAVLFASFFGCIGLGDWLGVLK